MPDTSGRPRGPHMASSAMHHVDQNSVAEAIFHDRVLKEGFPVVHNESWATQASTVELPGERLFVHALQWGRREVVRADGALADIGLWVGQVNVAVAAESEEQARKVVERLRELMPTPDPSAAQEVTVTFWTYGPHGPQPAWRTISVPSWGDIDANYAARTREGLDRLMRGFRPAHGGQLVLWHGGVGTGKTFALRALAWEWRDWCDLHYIVDPDSFFGQHADYLMHVLLQSEWEGQFAAWTGSDRLGVTEPVIVGESGEETARERKSWRLLVLEDTGELLQPDAKAIIGQGLSRFLNVVDGLIGQGLRVLVLVTTNEEIRKLHPAVARPGRSAANVRFDQLSVDEASDWLAAHGVGEQVTAASSIAELYARLEGLSTPKPSIGFDDRAS